MCAHHPLSKIFKHPNKPGLPLPWSASQSKQVFSKRAKPAVLRRLDVCFFKQSWLVGNLDQLHVTLFLQLFALQSNVAQYTIMSLSSKQPLSLSTVRRMNGKSQSRSTSLSSVTSRRSLPISAEKNMHTRGKPVE